MDRLLTMIARRVVFRLVNKGVDAGIDRFGRKSSGAGEDRDASSPQPRPDLRETKRTARQAIRMGRRLGRF